MFSVFVESHFLRFWHNLHNPNATYYLGTLGLALVLEALALGYRRSSLHRLISLSPSARNDLACDALTVLGLSRVVAVVGAFGIPLFLSSSYQRYVGFTLLAHVHSPLLGYAIWFILLDFEYYWYHRLTHEITCLWQAHKYHHSALEFNIITGNRSHVIDTAVGEICKAIPLALLGMPPPVYASVRLGVRFLEMVQHSDIAWDFGFIGRWLFFAPVGHRIHHSTQPEHWDCNYGNFLVIWDRLFGTWYAGGRVNEAVGVSGNHFNTGSVVRDWYSAARYFWRDAWRGIRTGRWRTDYARECAEERGFSHRFHSLFGRLVFSGAEMIVRMK